MDDFLRQVRDDHHQFDKGKLEDHVGDEPMALFNKWFQEATLKPVNEPNAISIATIGSEGFPLSRIVYLKEVLAEGFVFYTNYNSEKGKSIANNPKVNALIFWPELERQISITGLAKKVPSEMSDAYFHSRPRSSKLGAWASFQSEVLDSRSTLEVRLNEFSERFPNEVPRPEHWGGYIIEPTKIEFWQGRPSRLHDRIVFEKTATDSWKVYRKNP